MTDVTDKVERAIARFERVTQSLDDRDGPARDAARRERQRLNSGLGRTAAKIAGVVAMIWIVAMLIGFFRPIGMIGFAVALFLTIAGVGLMIERSAKQTASTPPPPADLPNGAMVDRFDSYIYRVRGALPAPARAELDEISKILPSLKQTLERLEAIDPAAQDARRLMSMHLPGLIERYERVPPAYRQEQDGEGKTVDQRLLEGLAAGHAALAETCEQLARADVAALETQGRFIESRYGDGSQLARPGDVPDRNMIDS